MSDEELRSKFDDNAGPRLQGPARDRLYDAIMRLDRFDDAAAVVSLTMA
jgi:hypothetical protein